MDILIKTSAGILLAVILGMVLSKQGKDMTLLLTVAVCCMVAMAALNYLSPVVDFFEKLQSIGQLDGQMFGILLKAVGIGLLSEIISLICTDAGNAALGKGLQLLSAAAILWLSIPLLEQLMDLVEKILVNI